MPWLPKQMYKKLSRNVIVPVFLKAQYHYLKSRHVFRMFGELRDAGLLFCLWMKGSSKRSQCFSDSEAQECLWGTIVKGKEWGWRRQCHRQYCRVSNAHLEKVRLPNQFFAVPNRQRATIEPYWNVGAYSWWVGRWSRKWCGDWPFPPTRLFLE